MTHELHELHKAANNTLLGRLHSRLPGLRGGASYLCQAAEAPTERAPVPSYTAGTADAGSNFGGCEGTQGKGVKA